MCGCLEGNGIAKADKFLEEKVITASLGLL
jgi:hypothetical protein